ncbi:MAG: hypothetical protein AAGK04_13895 [Planctomycetota bacterium]
MLTFPQSVRRAVCRHAMACGVLAMLSTSAASAGPAVEPYIRVVEAPGDVVGLDIAIRTFEREDAPLVRLVGAVHIGQTDYYRDLQSYIEAHDLVLYEGVGGAGVIRDPLSDEARVDATRSRLRQLARAAYDHERLGFEGPLTPEALRRQGSPAQQYRVGRSFTDAFGHPVEMSVTTRFGVLDQQVLRRSATFTSYGADGRPGGAGFDTDLVFSTRELTNDQIDPDVGIQPRMARALGLVFQLEHMVFDRPNFINSDMDVPEMMAALEARGEDAEAAGEMLLGAMGGQGMMAGIAGAMLGMIERSPGAAVVARAIMADLLTQADEMMHSMPGGMGELMDVILIERNNVVIEDLNEAIETQPDLETIAIIYGAAHLAPLEEVLVDQYGYRPTGTEWRRAITADPTAAGVDPAFFKATRNFMRRSIEMQIRQAEMMGGRDDDS